MTSWFKGSAQVAAFLVMLLFVSVFLTAATPESSNIYNIGMGFLTATLCASPIVGLSLAVSGIGALVEKFNTDEATGTLKRKRKRRLTLDDLDDSQRMRRIMAQLTPPDRDYLRERLAAQRLGLSDDGEMVSLDEVLSEYEDTSRQADSD
jgi:hypothetical protein